MRLPIHATLVPALILGATPQAPASAEDTTQSPYFVIQGQDTGTETLPLKSTRAEVDIAGVIAHVTVTQVYTNTGATPIEATYVFPGSTRAAVHALTMTIGERVVHAQIKEKEAARRDYETAKQEGRSATLLEQHRPNVFQMNVANILPGDEIRVELQYTELLEPTDGTYQFTYPTVVGPRYPGRPGTASATGERWVASPYTPAGTVPATTFDIHVRLSAGMPIKKMACGTHKTDITYDGPDRATVRLDPSEAHGGNRDYLLKYQLAGGAVQSGLLLHRGSKENFFLLMAQPPMQVAPQDMPPREFVFIMDVSGSQNGFPLEISKELMKEMVQGLRPQDRFNVMVFEFSSALWRAESQAATPENLRDALAFVKAQQAGGGTELASAMKRALDLPRMKDISRTFVVSTDGFIAADDRIFDLIREHLGDANLFAFGIGSSVNRHLIEGMAHAGQGEAFVLTNPDQAKREADRFRRYVASPALTHVRLAAQGFRIYDVEPLNLPDVLAQRPVIAYGKWEGPTTGTLTVSGTTGTGPWSRVFAPGQCPVDEGNPALEQLWARKRIQLLSDYAQFGMTEARKQEITRLGLNYHLLTSFTSFVAVDPLVRNQGPAPMPVSQPLPMPQGVSNSAIGAAPALPRSAQVTPGVASTAYAGASATVEVVSATTTLDAGLCLKAPVRVRRVARRIRQVHVTEGAVRLGSLQADRPVPLLRVSQLVEMKLRQLAKTGAFQGMPKSFVLELKVDGSGAVSGVAFDQPTGKAGKLLEAQLLGWRLEAWTTHGTTLLRQPVEVLR